MRGRDTRPPLHDPSSAGATSPPWGELVGLDCRFYAGSHGFEIGGPDGWHEAVEQGGEALPQRDRPRRTCATNWPMFPAMRSSVSCSRWRSTIGAPRLPAARRAAQQAGCRGATFPWQSGSSGREECQKLHLRAARTLTETPT